MMAAKVKFVTYAESQASYWATQAFDADATVASSGADVLGTSRVTLSFTRGTPSGTREDRAATSFWVAKTVGASLYSKIPIAELSSLEAALDAFYASLRPTLTPDWTLVEYAWHQYDESTPRTQDGRGQKAGPAVRLTTKSLPGTSGTSTLPYQVASTVTQRTASRKHWGRSYLPGGAANSLNATTGRWTNGYVDALAGALNTLHDTWQTAGYQLGVWSQLHPAFLTPKTIECDDIPDIIRRRRAKQSNYRKLIS